MNLLGYYEPTPAMIEAATGHVEAARRTTMHASHHARAALIDAAAADDRLKGAVKALQEIATGTGRWIDAKMIAVEALREIGAEVARPSTTRGQSE